MSGWIYIFVNEAMPGLVKIGMTERQPQDRLRELSKNTSCPIDFECHAAWFIDGINTYEIETIIHKQFNEDRMINNNREFFRVNPELASKKIINFLSSQENNGVRVLDYFIGVSEAVKTQKQKNIQKQKAETKVRVDNFINKFKQNYRHQLPVVHNNQHIFYEWAKAAEARSTILTKTDARKKLIDAMVQAISQENTWVMDQQRIKKEREKIHYKRMRERLDRERKKRKEVEERAKIQLEEARKAGKQRRECLSHEVEQQKISDPTEEIEPSKSKCFRFFNYIKMIFSSRDDV